LDNHSKQAWYALNPGDPPRSTLFVNQEKNGTMINLGEKAYRNVNQQRYFGQVYLAPYSSLILIEDGLAPLSMLSISPNMVAAGSADFELVVVGSGYTEQSVVRVNGIDHTTRFDSSQQLTTTIDSVDVANVGVLPVTVFDPIDGGLETPAIPLWVVESITSIYLPLIRR
jgi:hypothetical protein